MKTRIKNVEHLMQCARDRRAVTYAPHPRHQAAAFVMSMQARVVINIINRGMFIYTPKKKALKSK